MSPNELKALLNSMKAAADVVEAINHPNLQSRRGWDLTGWSYVLVPGAFGSLTATSRRRSTSKSRARRNRVRTADSMKHDRKGMHAYTRRQEHGVDDAVNLMQLLR
jgi:hypothetical protein